MPKERISVNSVTDLEKKLGYEFKEKELLRQALTHRSAIHENHPQASNRDLLSLAFVGDAVLKYAVARYLFLNGQADVRSSRAQLHEAAQKIIPNNVLVQIGRQKLHLKEYLIRGNAHREPSPDMYADCMEAIFGAIALDCGIDRQEVIFRVIEKTCFQRIEPWLESTEDARMVVSRGKKNDWDDAYNIDRPKDELELALSECRTTPRSHKRSCSQKLIHLCLRILAVFGVLATVFIIYSEEFRSKLKLYEL